MQDSTDITASTVKSGYFTTARLGVSLLFLANGLFMGSWTPKVPEIVARLDLSPSLVGTMVLMFGIGSITIMPVSSAMIAKIGSARTVKIAMLLLLPIMMLLTLAPDYVLAVAVCFFFGGFLGAMDIAMNTNAVEVERSMQRSIMSSCHAFWSLGALMGAASGGYLIEHVGAISHAAIVTILYAFVITVAFPIIMLDTPRPSETKIKARLPASIFPWLIGLVALFGMMPEGSVFDWSALYLNEELDASLTVASLGGAAFFLTMTIMRFAGDMVRDRLGAVLTVRISAIFAAIGMFIAGTAGSPSMAIIGFGITGIGLSNIVPIAFSAAGNLPGMAQGVGLSVATIMGYSGALFAPTLIGFVAEHTGFAPIYASFPILFVVVLGLSHLTRHADEIKTVGH